MSFKKSLEKKKKKRRKYKKLTGEKNKSALSGFSSTKYLV